jgi:DNA polymerase I-like protein with 3'-5' exonuclease and polymerase domains
MHKFETHFVDSDELFTRLKAYESKLDPSLPLTFDLETNNKEELKADIYGIGLCFTDSTAFYIPIKNPKGNLLFSPPKVKEIYQWIFTIAKKRGLCGWNVLYDILVFDYNTGYVMDDFVVLEGMLMKHLLDEEPPFALKENAVRYLGNWADKAQQVLKDEVLAKGGRWTKDEKDMYLASTKTLGEYCCWDVILTNLLCKEFYPTLEEENLLELYETEVLPLYKLCTINMKRKGFPIDLEHFKKLNLEIAKDLKDLEDDLHLEVEEEVEPFCMELLQKEFPIKKTGNFPKALAEVLGAPLPVTKAGKVTMSQKAIEKQRDATPEFRDFYDWVLDKTAQYIQTGMYPSDVTDREGFLYKVRLKMFEDKHGHQRVFNFNSSDHLAELFIKIRGMQPLGTTDTGKPKVDKEFVAHLDSMGDSIASKLNVYKKLSKIQSTYIEGILSRQFNGVIHTSMLQHGTTSGRFSSRNPNCLSLDTEILTEKGWKTYDKLKPDTKVAAYNNQEIIFERPNCIYVSDNSLKNIISVKNQHFDMRLTSNHRVIWKDRKNLKIKESPAANFPKDGHILHGSVFYSNSKGYDLDWLRFLVATQADAHIRKDSSKVYFCFNKKRKYERLLNILNLVQLKYEKEITKQGQYKIKVLDVKQRLVECLGYDKTFPKNWITLGCVERNVVLEEIFYWDGSYTRKNNYSSNNETNIDIIQALCSLNGWRAHKRIYITKADNNNYQLDIIKRDYSGTANVEIISENSYEKVWCVSVPSGKILVRRGSDTFITGNCQNLSKPIEEQDKDKFHPLIYKYTNAIREGFIAPKGYKLVDADYASLEPRVFAHMSGDPKLIAVFNRGEDLYSRIAIDVFNLDGVSANPDDSNYLKKVEPSFRQKAKVFTLAVPYCAEASRISHEMNTSYGEAKKIIDSYLRSYPKLKQYMANCNYQAKTLGYVKTELGRVRHLREVRAMHVLYGNKFDITKYKEASERNLLEQRRKFKNGLNNAKNFRIQGLAAHIVNRAMIEIEKEFRQKGIDGYVASQIHDQIVCVVREDQAQQAKDIIRDKMENTTKISVPLLAEPQIANNLKDSH